MKVQITIDMDDAAFDDTHELSRILSCLATQVDGNDYNELTDPYDRTGRITDINGNTVGKIAITGRR